jgi:hypothetical protein
VGAGAGAGARAGAGAGAGANWTTSTKIEALLAEVEAGRRRGSAKHGDGSGALDLN